jgi:hypothetical protein
MLLSLTQLKLLQNFFETRKKIEITYDVPFNYSNEKQDFFHFYEIIYYLLKHIF